MYVYEITKQSNEMKLICKNKAILGLIKLIEESGSYIKNQNFASRETWKVMNKRRTMYLYNM